MDVPINRKIFRLTEIYTVYFCECAAANGLCSVHVVKKKIKEGVVFIVRALY